MSKNTKQKFIIGAGLIAGTFVVLDILGKSSKKKDDKNIDDGNQYLNKDKNDIDILNKRKIFILLMGKELSIKHYPLQD